MACARESLLAFYFSPGVMYWQQLNKWRALSPLNQFLRLNLFISFQGIQYRSCYGGIRHEGKILFYLNVGFVLLKHVLRFRFKEVGRANWQLKNVQEKWTTESKMLFKLCSLPISCCFFLLLWSRILYFFFKIFGWLFCQTCNAMTRWYQEIYILQHGEPKLLVIIDAYICCIVPIDDEPREV